MPLRDEQTKCSFYHEACSVKTVLILLAFLYTTVCLDNITLNITSVKCTTHSNHVSQQQWPVKFVPWGEQLCITHISAGLLWHFGWGSKEGGRAEGVHRQVFHQMKSSRCQVNALTLPCGARHQHARSEHYREAVADPVTRHCIRVRFEKQQQNTRSVILYGTTTHSCAPSCIVSICTLFFLMHFA